jgi:hypothetical protein
LLIGSSTPSGDSRPGVSQAAATTTLAASAVSPSRSVRRQPSPSRASGDVAVDEHGPFALRAVGERADDGQRAVEVAVELAPDAADDAVGIEAFDELGGLGGRDGAGRNVQAVLQRQAAELRVELLLGGGDEQVAAGRQVGIDGGREVRVDVGVEGERLAGHPAGDLGAPLLAHPAGLDRRGPGADATSVEDRDGEPAPRQLPGRGQARDPCADHCHVGPCALASLQWTGHYGQHTE